MWLPGCTYILWMGFELLGRGLFYQTYSRMLGRRCSIVFLTHWATVLICCCNPHCKAGTAHCRNSFYSFHEKHEHNTKHTTHIEAQSPPDIEL